MILDYEKEFLTKVMGDYFKDLTVANYATDDSLFTLTETALALPAFYFNRGEFELRHSRKHKVRHAGREFKASVADLSYQGYLLVERQSDSISFLKRVQQFFDEQPYTVLGDKPCEIPISQRLQYIKVNEIRNAKDSRGSLRQVHFSWNVRLLVGYDIESRLSEVKEVRLIINDQQVKTIKY